MESAPDLSPALDAALTRHADLVRRVSRRHGFGGVDLDEVVQAVRIRLWRALRSGERITAIEPSYVRRAAVSAAIDLIRARRAGPATDSIEALPEHPVEGRTAEPDRALARRELEDRVSATIGELPASRQPVVRMYLAGYNSQEIADTFGWTEAKARNLLYRGMAELRERLTTSGITAEAWQ